MGSEIKTKFFPGIRSIIQIFFLALTLEIGLQFYIYVLQASSDGSITVTRPPGVEAFLPIGGLMGWKRFITEGRWDATHPASMVVLGIAVLISIVFRKSFCGWVCPVGTISGWLWKTGNIIFKKNFRLPAIADYCFRSLKYLLLVFFIFTIFSMPANEIGNFLNSPYYKMSDVRMLFFFTKISTAATIVLITLFTGSLFIKNFWCRYMCPYGGLLGLLALISPSRINRNRSSCIECGKCSKNCPYDLPVDIKQTVYSPECNGCMECVNACPVEKTLSMKIFGKPIKVSRFAIILPLIFFLTVYLAKATGYWKGNVSDHEFRSRLKAIELSDTDHPGGMN